MTDLYPFSDEGLAQALAWLGASEDAIAARLTAGGWRGPKDDCEHCPVANFLLATFAADRVEVNQLGVSVEREVRIFTDSDLDVQQQTIVAETPNAVADFIGDFDSGNYPDLIKEAA